MIVFHHVGNSSHIAGNHQQACIHCFEQRHWHIVYCGGREKDIGFVEMVINLIVVDFPGEGDVLQAKFLGQIDEVLVFAAVAQQGQRGLRALYLHLFKSTQDAGDVVQGFVSPCTDVVRLESFPQAEMAVVELQYVWDGDVWKLMLFKYLGKESREYDIGVGTCQEVVYQLWMLVEE